MTDHLSPFPNRYTFVCAGTCVLVGPVDKSGSRNDLCRVAGIVSSHLDKGNAVQEQDGVFVGLLLTIPTFEAYAIYLHVIPMTARCERTSLPGSNIRCMNGSQA